MAWSDGWWSEAVQRASPNVDARPEGCVPELLVMHNISLPPNQFGGSGVDELFMNQLDPAEHPYYATIQGLEVSTHFFIRRTGEVVQYASCDARAWHAGASTWRGRTRCNDFSIGVEWEGADGVPYTALQYQSALRLIGALRACYPTLNGIAGHSDIAPARKTDPSASFEWARLVHEANIPKAWRHAVDDGVC